jgi:dTDP-4-dehydrorhamnose 3,5-epimerase-like enzyme
MSLDFDKIPKGVIVKQWPYFIDNLGVLFPIEFSEINFMPKRIFCVSNVPAGGIRGGHAHYQTKQYLFCVKGKIKVLVQDKEKSEFVLTEGQGYLIDSMVWDSQQFLTGNDVLLVICSEPYRKEDYILDYDEFRKLKQNENSNRD